MALTYASLGQVDVPATAVGQTGGPTDCTVRIADVTIGTVSADYSSGLALVGSSLGVNGVLQVVNAAVRASSGTLKPMIQQWDANTRKLRFYLQGSATTVSPVEITATTHLADGDIVRITFIGA